MDTKKIDRMLQNARSEIEDAESSIDSANSALSEIEHAIEENKPDKSLDDMCLNLSIADLEDLRDKINLAIKLRLVGA